MIKRGFFLFFCLFIAVVTAKEPDLKVQAAVMELEALHKKILSAQDTAKLSLNGQFRELLSDMLHDHASLSADLSNLKCVSVLTAPKNKFRIYTWPIEIAPGHYDYFGFTQYLASKQLKRIKVVELQNTAFEMSHRVDETYKSDQWKGGLYYELIPSKKKHAKTFLMLGWDGHDKRSTKKMIEVISFSSRGEPIFGAPILHIEDKAAKKNPRLRQQVGMRYYTVHRHEFEYSAKVSMMLRYDSDLKMVVFDHLSPINQRLTSVKATYVPDYSYDGFIAKKGKWYMRSNLDLRNETQVKSKKYKPSDIKE